jgi:hypothetical protein
MSFSRNKILAIALMLCVPCWATDYFVSPLAGSDANTGLTFALAFENTQKGADSAIVAGDNVFLCQSAPDTTTLDIDLDLCTGTTAAYINFISYDATGDAPADGFIIQAVATWTGTGLVTMVDASDYIKFTGVTFDANGLADHALFNNFDTPLEPAFLRCDFKNATSHGVNVRGSTVWQFTECNSFDNTGSGVAHSAGNRANIQWAAGSLRDNGVAGWDLNSSRCLASNVLIHNNVTDGVFVNTNGTAFVLIDSTVSLNGGDGLDLDSAATDTYTNISGNTFSSNTGYGIRYTTGGGNRVQTMARNHYYGNLDHSDLGANLSDQPGENNQEGDPLFADVTPGSEDFTPGAGSPLIRNGANASNIGAVAHVEGGGGTAFTPTMRRSGN